MLTRISRSDRNANLAHMCVGYFVASIRPHGVYRRAAAATARLYNIIASSLRTARGGGYIKALYSEQNWLCIYFLFECANTTHTHKCVQKYLCWRSVLRAACVCVCIIRFRRAQINTLLTRVASSSSNEYSLVLCIRAIYMFYVCRSINIHVRTDYAIICVCVCVFFTLS